MGGKENEKREPKSKESWVQSQWNEVWELRPWVLWGVLTVKYNTGYSFINLKVPQDFRAIYVKELSFKSRCYCSCSGFEKAKQGTDSYKGKGARAQVFQEGRDCTAPGRGGRCREETGSSVLRPRGLPCPISPPSRGTFPVFPVGSSLCLSLKL